MNRQHRRWYEPYKKWRTKDVYPNPCKNWKEMDERRGIYNKKWDTECGHSPCRNRRHRDAAKELIAGGFHLYTLERYNEFPCPTLDNQKFLKQEWNWLPEKYDSRTKQKAAINYVRSFYFKHYTAYENDHSEFRKEIHEYQWL